MRGRYEMKPLIMNKNWIMTEQDFSTTVRKKFKARSLRIGLIQVHLG